MAKKDDAHPVRRYQFSLSLNPFASPNLLEEGEERAKEGVKGDGNAPALFQLFPTNLHIATSNLALK